MNFAFFGLETTGITPAFDHPLQFAAILTDAEFREIERVHLRGRLATHVIPSPQALAVTGVRPHKLVDPELPSLFEFAQELTVPSSAHSSSLFDMQYERGVVSLIVHQQQFSQWVQKGRSPPCQSFNLRQLECRACP